MDAADLGARMEELSGGGGGGRIWLCYDVFWLDMYFEDDYMMGMSSNVIMTMYDRVFTIWWLAHVCLCISIILFIIVEQLNFGAR